MGNSYQVVADTLGNRESRKIANNSYLVQTSGKRDREGFAPTAGTIAYKLHGTYVVLYHGNGAVELNTGGWRTVTTKDRINRCFNQYGPAGYRVWSDRGTWYLYLDNAKVAAFADGMVIHPDGSITGAMSAAEIKARDASNAKLAKLLKRYIASLKPSVAAEVMQDDGMGDCFFCKGMVTGAELRDGKLVMTGPSTSVDHLWDHLTERYYMYTLFANAIIAGRFGNPAVVWHLILAEAKGETFGGTPRVSDMLTRSLTRYFVAALRIS